MNRSEPTPVTHDATSKASSGGLRAIAVASTIGTTIENFDISLFLMAAAFLIAPIFLPADAPGSAQVQSLATIAVSFVARPVGAVLFGYFGDRRGRKSTLIGSLLLMGGSTLLIGCMPTYSTLGAYAFPILCVLRFAQGASAGGEFSGALLLAVESVPAARRFCFGAYPQVGNALGAAVAVLFMAALVHALPLASLRAWGWRIPFLFSAVLISIGVYVRRRVAETPVFQAAHARARVAPAPLPQLLKGHWRTMVLGGCAVLTLSVGAYLTTLFVPVYAQAKLGADRQAMLLASFVGLAVGGATSLIAGRLADRTGPWGWIAAANLVLLAAGLLLPFCASRGAPGLIAFMIVGSAACPIPGALVLTSLARAFPPEMRYTGVSFTQTVTAALAAIVTPTLIQRQSAGGDLTAVGLDLVVTALISLAAMAVLARRPAGSAQPEEAAEVADPAPAR